MKSIRISKPAADLSSAQLVVENGELPHPEPDQYLVRIQSAGVNPSDVKAVTGAFPQAVWPRTPGRDFAGTVIDGPSEWIGKEVWGSGGELGITRDGTHATHVLLPLSTLSEKPRNMSLLEAGAIGVPFLAAYVGLQRASFPLKGENVLVFGANGKVGQAVIQLASRQGARIFGVEREKVNYIGHSNTEVTMISATDEKIEEAIQRLTGGHGADLIFNTVGSPYFASANLSLAHGGRQIFIATIERSVPFDILQFFRGEFAYYGVDTGRLSTAQTAVILNTLRPWFEEGSLRPFPILRENMYVLSQAQQAYEAVLHGAKERVVLYEPE